MPERHAACVIYHLACKMIADGIRVLPAFSHEISTTHESVDTQAKGLPPFECSTNASIDMSDNEAYMLQRDNIESNRLETQHEFVKALAHGHLIHHCIPQSSLRAIADVGTGTGAWLKDVALTLDHDQHPELGLVGFDISPKQFPSQKIDRLEFLVQDITVPFDTRHHEHFDLVNVRLLSYALQARQLKQAVANVVQLVRQSPLSSKFSIKTKDRSLTILT